MSDGDAILSCPDCGGTFYFTASERKHYRAKGYDDPVRCPACRRERRIWKDEIKRRERKKYEKYRNDKTSR